MSINVYTEKEANYASKDMATAHTHVGEGESR